MLDFFWRWLTFVSQLPNADRAVLATSPGTTIGRARWSGPAALPVPITLRESGGHRSIAALCARNNGPCRSSSQLAPLKTILYRNALVEDPAAQWRNIRFKTLSTLTARNGFTRYRSSQASSLLRLIKIFPRTCTAGSGLRNCRRELGRATSLYSHHRCGAMR